MATKAKKKTAGIPKAVDFKSLTKTQRRVAIAQDVIDALAAKRYNAAKGTYVRSWVSAEGVFEGADKLGYAEVDVQQALKANMESCTVCAKGAMFMAAVEKFDRLKVVIFEDANVLGGFNDDEAVCDHLENYFDRKQLDLIEYAFEGKNFKPNVPLNLTETEEWVMAGYAPKYPKSADRMTAIMENIVRNNGKFVVKIEEL